MEFQDHSSELTDEAKGYEVIGGIEVPCYPSDQLIRQLSETIMQR